MMKLIYPENQEEFVIQQTQLMLRSYKHWLGRDLFPAGGEGSEVAVALFNAPFALLSANNEEDPILNYGNKVGLGLWEMSWEDLVKTPGRKTAEEGEREKREAFLKQVEKNGFVDNYEGVRISSSGRRFKIEKAIVWNLIDSSGVYRGQAATFNRWAYLD